MSSVQEIEAVLPKLSRAEMEEIRALIDTLIKQSGREPAPAARLIRENGKTLGLTARTVTLADTQKALEDFP